MLGEKAWPETIKPSSSQLALLQGASLQGQLTRSLKGLPGEVGQGTTKLLEAKESLPRKMSSEHIGVGTWYSALSRTCFPRTELTWARWCLHGLRSGRSAHVEGTRVRIPTWHVTPLAVRAEVKPWLQWTWESLSQEAGAISHTRQSLWVQSMLVSLSWQLFFHSSPVGSHRIEALSAVNVKRPSSPFCFFLG